MSFEFWAFTPNPSAQNSKHKKKFENFFKKKPTIVGKEKECIS